MINHRLKIAFALAASITAAGWMLPASATEAPATEAQAAEVPAATPLAAPKAAVPTAVKKLARSQPVVKRRAPSHKLVSLAANTTLDCTFGLYCRGHYPLLLGVGF
jgi:hypothetical protein